jgi:hypothetical protein
MTPYAASGSFTSRVFDAGEIVNWGALSWIAATPAGTPAGTSVAFSVRTGNTSVPDGSWTSFTTVAMSGGAIAARSRYAQYRATLATSNAAATPSVDEVTIGFARNTPPAAGNDTYAMDQGTTLSVPAPGVLANDTDPDHDVLAAALVSGPAHGAVILNADGSFSYTPQAVFSGSDSFTYTAGDGIAVSAPATVTITVRAVVPPPAPADWFMAAWSAGGSATTTDNGVIVDGARTGTNATYAPGRSLEFVATFSGDAWQHIGFGVDYNAAPWIMFSTFQGGGLYARTATGSGDSIDTPLAGNWFGSAHRYRIDWNASNTVFSIDGTVVATHALAVTASLRPLISDFNAGGGSIVVASITIGSISGLPANWFSAAWAEGGSARASNGTLTIDGARAGSNVLYGPGQSVEFVATFSGDAWQHIGFGLDYDAAPWIIFSTFLGGQLCARTKTQDGQSVDTPVPGNWLGSEHRYRIDWNANSAVFSIDGTVVATTTVSIQDHLRALVSDFNVAGGTIAVTSVH